MWIGLSEGGVLVHVKFYNHYQIFMLINKKEETRWTYFCNEMKSNLLTQLLLLSHFSFVVISLLETNTNTCENSFRNTFIFAFKFKLELIFFGIRK